MKGLYISIPFVKNVYYYDNKIQLIDKTTTDHKKYLEALINEFNVLDVSKQRFDTVHIGGGDLLTYSINEIEKILKMIDLSEVKEFTVELYPDTFNDEKLNLLMSYGLNRASLHIQTFNSDLLRIIGAKYSFEKINKILLSLVKLNIDVLNIDMLYGIPTQTLEMVKNDINILKTIKPDHISYYFLIAEEDSLFGNDDNFLKFHENNVDLETNMFNLVNDCLPNYGYEHYEITNFALNNKYSEHSLIYWKLEEYVGLGLGASSYYNNIRYINSSLFDEYIESSNIIKIVESDEDNLSNYMIFGLRLLKGIDLKEVKSKFNVNLFEKFPELNSKIDQGLVEVFNDHLRLTDKGILLGNQVFEVFI